jgi:hypothetical protein
MVLSTIKDAPRSLRVRCYPSNDEAVANSARIAMAIDAAGDSGNEDVASLRGLIPMLECAIASRVEIEGMSFTSPSPGTRVFWAKPPLCVWLSLIEAVDGAERLTSDATHRPPPQQLRELQADGMITRNVLPEVLPRVEYEAPISRGLSRRS